VQCSAVQCSAVQCSAVQCSAVKLSVSKNKLTWQAGDSGPSLRCIRTHEIFSQNSVFRLL
jgi:hypothetical protein